MKIKPLLVAFSFILSIVGYFYYTNLAYLSSFTNAVDIAIELEVEMEKYDITGHYGQHSIEPFKTSHPKVYNLLNILLEKPHVASFERRETGECAYSSIWCKDPHCGEISGYLTQHIVTNNRHIDAERYKGNRIAQKRLKSNWYYTIYQKFYP